MKIQQAVKYFLFVAIPLCIFLVNAEDSFAAARVKKFFNPETSSSKDGSIFPGGACTTCNPADKDGSIFPGGSCVNCPTTKCVKCEKKPTVKNYEMAYDDEIYKSVYRDCKNFAPVSLEYVDFRIKKGKKYEPFSSKLGKYRFRIFGCRRFEKEAILNQGRIMQKDMRFIPIFNQIVGGCYPIVQMPETMCLETSPTPLPEYILTAEITDYYMNLCDEYDWDKANKEDLRTGTSEMTVTWRLMDITKTNVFWKGTSTGYAEVDNGEHNAEIALVEQAFADAVSNLRNLPGFEKQLATRVHPKEHEAERLALIEAERIANPVKCQFKPEIQQAAASEFTTVQEALPADNTASYELCGMSPGQLDINGQLLPTCQITGPETAIVLDTVNVIETPVTEIVEDSGVISNGGITKLLPPIGTETLVIPAETGTVDEDAGVILSGTGINETGGITSSSEFEEAKPQISESSGMIDGGSAGKENIAIVDDSWIDIDSENREAGEQAFFESGSSLCIIDRAPYDRLTPENLYKIRASIVGITNNNGKRGAGLIVSDQFVLTSADLITKEINRYDLETINGAKLKASVFRVNPSKNTALLVLDEKTRYTPLSLNLDLPDVGQTGFIALGLLDIDGDFENGEGYIDDNGTVSGYRYSEQKGAEIIIDTFVQTVTSGGALIDKHGTINGISASSKTTEDNPDLFIPTETALRSLGLSICGKPFIDKSPWQKFKPLTEAIKNNSGNKDPAVMAVGERK